MSTHDLVIANDTNPNLRADMNSGLAAIATQQSGTADPPAMYSYERQARTDLGQMRRRNAANSGWVLDGTLAETYLISRSTNTILAGANHQCTIVASSTFTQTLTAAATLGDGWGVNYRNDGTGVITLDPNASETIDGATTLVLNPGDSCVILCNGSAFKTIGRRQTALMAKAWGFVTFSAGAPTLQDSEGVSSIADTATGRTTVTLSTAMLSANYAVLVTASDTTTQNARMTLAMGLATTTFIVEIMNNTPVLVDSNFSFAVFGDQ